MTLSNTRVWPEAKSPALNGVRVLIVEDSWDVGIGLKSLLEAWGADTVGPVATPHDAMRLVAERAPDVALVDINLRSGDQLCIHPEVEAQQVKMGTENFDVINRIAALLYEQYVRDFLKRDLHEIETLTIAALNPTP